MVWPKLSVSDYPEMLRKLSASMFVVTTACVWFIRTQIPAVDAIFRSFDFTGIPVLDGVTVPFGTFAVGVIAAIASESIKLHDRISDVLRIRASFDLHCILIPMALLAGAEMKRARAERIAFDRRRLMGEVFYKYASSAKNASIDSHLIRQALTAWSWYWMAVEAMAVLIPAAAVLASFGRWKYAALILALVLVLQLLMRMFRTEANKYAEAEVNEILADAARRKAVRSAFDAL